MCLRFLGVESRLQAHEVLIDSNRVLEAVRERRFRTTLVEANGTLRAAFYRLGNGGNGGNGGMTLFALQILEAKDRRIRVVDHFTTASSHDAFFAEGLARTIAAMAR